MRQPCRRGDTARGTPPNGAYWWLHAKPLDAAIGCVLAPYWLGGRHGHCPCRRVQNTNKTQLLASNYCTFLLAELSICVTRKGPSTHFINATSFVIMRDTTIQKEAISYISSYQTLTADKNSKSHLQLNCIVRSGGSETHTFW